MEKASLPGIHTFISTSDVHLHHQLRISREEVISRAAQSSDWRDLFPDWVEFSCMDANAQRSRIHVQGDPGSGDEGAGTINIPDTVGYSYPQEVAELIQSSAKRPRIEKVIISVHCTTISDLPSRIPSQRSRPALARWSCTINGIGERAGNASLEEIAMILKTREKTLGFHTGIVSEQFPYEQARDEHYRH